MKNKKAISWEKLSEGTLTVGEIIAIQKFKQPIRLILGHVNGHPLQVVAVQISPVRGPAFNVENNLSTIVGKVNKKPYKYLSCAVRRAVKEYKSLIRTGQWRVITK